MQAPARQVNRRTFLKGAGATVAGITGLVTALKPLLSLERGEITLIELLQKHYQELGPDDLQRILKKLEEQTKTQYGVQPSIAATQPQEGVQFAYALSLTKCVGCRRCAHACLAENNQSREGADDISMSYIRVLELDKGSINLEESDQYYDGPVPKKDKYYMPVQCHQCQDSPCTKACPVEATWMEPDGLVVVDYNWCIGCRYCMAACPYDARRFNWKKPNLDEDAINPKQEYLGNRIRPQGVVEKCTFCLQRTRQGKYPACLEVCPTGARVFGNLLDPDSEINYILQNKRVYILKEDAGTQPKFFYYFD